jgi:hypothetical protein
MSLPKVPSPLPIRDIIWRSTDYTLSSSDSGAMVKFLSTKNLKLTIPRDVCNIGTMIVVEACSTGGVTICPDGVSLLGKNAFSFETRGHTNLVLVKQAANAWAVVHSGDSDIEISATIEPQLINGLPTELSKFF